MIVTEKNALRLVADGYVTPFEAIEALESIEENWNMNLTELKNKIDTLF